MSMNEFWSCFHELYETLPRQGPGDRESTERALRLLPPLTAGQHLLDIGCGSGAQTLDLARATEARIVAVDNHPPFVAAVTRRAAELGLGERITAQVADMGALPFPDGSFDVVWSEGAIFILGFTEGLTRWRRLLAPGGYLVVSEYCWLQENPAAELREFLGGDEADVGDVAARRAAIAACGYRLVADFLLPERGWWENYYEPLARGLESFRASHGDNPVATEVAARSEREIELHRRHAGAFGYSYFVMTRA